MTLRQALAQLRHEPRGRIAELPDEAVSADLFRLGEDRLAGMGRPWHSISVRRDGTGRRRYARRSECSMRKATVTVCSSAGSRRELRGRGQNETSRRARWHHKKLFALGSA